MPTPKIPNRIERLENRIGGLRAKVAKSQADLQAAYQTYHALEREDSAKARLSARNMVAEINALEADCKSASDALYFAESQLPVLKAESAKLNSRVRELDAANGAFDSIRPALQTVVEKWPAIFATFSPQMQRATYDQASGVLGLSQTANNLRAQLTEAREELARWEAQ